jgi:RyR domain-containing protein
MSYQPRPIDVTGVALPIALARLGEVLAENAHDLWAEERMAQGWTHGPRRDDVLKTHPSLVPYSALPESEKDLDRRTALGTLKAILALGYHIDEP